MAKRDLRLNSLSRYSKTSTHFALEEHAHCEAPAGCGGVVIRWFNPDRGIPVELWFFATGHANIYIDGGRPKSGRSALLIFAGVYDEDKNGVRRVSPTTGNKIYILSSDDGSWKYTSEGRGDNAWMLTEYDDSDWRPMVPRELPPLGEDWRVSYRVKKAAEFGAVPLGISTPASHVWIRKAFSLTRS